MTVRRHEPWRVVLIGPECTGKTWLARELASHYGVPWSEEYARLFVEEHPRQVVYGDVDTIGSGQQAGEDEALSQARRAGARLVIHDTDLVSTAVYSWHYYGDCPAWIEPAASARRSDLYLLHQTDVPWVADGHQRVDPDRRAELFVRFRATLAALETTVVEIGGGWDDRRRAAIAAVDAHTSQSLRE
jgi:NadR type nicotinamide-nucleotide adenylyltransferase